MINLDKRADAVRIVLAKRNILKAPTMRVGMALDITGSAKHLYKNGTMQEVADRSLAVASQFDDNGELDMWAFTTGFDRLKPATAADYGKYVQEHILNNPKVTKWGGTSYAPVLADMSKFYFGGVEKLIGFVFGLFGKKKPAPRPWAYS